MAIESPSHRVGQPRTGGLPRRAAVFRHRSRRALEIVRHEGLLSLLARLAALAGYRRGIVMSMSLTPAPPLVETDVELEYGFLEPGQLAAFTEYRPDIGAEVAEERLARGERCFVAWYGDRIVSARWITRGRVRAPEFRLSLTLAADAVFTYDSYTCPDLRGRRVASAAATRSAAALSAEGAQQAFVTVLPENGAGIRNAERSGYREVGRFAVLVLGPLPALRVPYLGRSRR